MSKKNLSIAHFAMIHDLLPCGRGHRGKSHAVIVSDLRRDGVDVSLKQVERALKSMEGQFGLIRGFGPRGELRWKRSNPESMGQHFYLEDLKGEPLDPLETTEEWETEYSLTLPGARSMEVH
ncbi:hypothetical protein HFP89_08185 [Wenzhouxiangella sp. XN79A]|uniref:hypothetical protein n=1 Tax=Wenzhouxiangella sp. XN79A TaxID=2724193 RepID=UPI00144A5F64|nr:hypothetical protein [Wenzhouxiangella sp. XN79A]NKI35143.1 hypothetical protein [Wenzhouxiangella sp. XN79A]